MDLALNLASDVMECLCKATIDVITSSGKFQFPYGFLFLSNITNLLSCMLQREIIVTCLC